jgi:hypothetical protein
MSAVRRYPLIVFFVLAYVFSWWPWPLYALGLAPGYIVGFGPFLAALVVLALTRGKVGILGLLKRMVRWRVGPEWYAWLFNNTGGSVLLVMLFHTMNNVISGGFFHAMYSGTDWVRQGWLLVALWCAVAVIVVIVNGPEHLSRKYNKQTPTPPESSTLASRVA